MEVILDCKHMIYHLHRPIKIYKEWYILIFEIHFKNENKSSPYNGYPMQLIVQFNLHYSYCTVQFLIVFTRVDNFNDYVSLEF